MPLTDPRYVIRSMLDPAIVGHELNEDNVTLDDDSTKAKIEVVYDQPEYYLTTTLHEQKVDLLMLVNDKVYDLYLLQVLLWLGSILLLFNLSALRNIIVAEHGFLQPLYL